MYCKLVSCADFKAILMDEGQFMVCNKEAFYVELSR